jgi:hypothetical protein
VTRAVGVTAALLAGGLGAACAEPERPPGPSWSVGTHPRAADHYADLFRAFLSATDPVVARQRLACERTRLSDALGGREASRRIEGAQDTLRNTRADTAAYERADAATQRKAFELKGPTCDSLRAAADREEGPIPPAPDSLRAR